MQRVELDPRFVVNSDDCFLESLDHLGAVLENWIGAVTTTTMLMSDCLLPITAGLFSLRMNNG